MDRIADRASCTTSIDIISFFFKMSQSPVCEHCGRPIAVDRFQGERVRCDHCGRPHDVAANRRPSSHAAEPELRLKDDESIEAIPVQLTPGRGDFQLKHAEADPEIKPKMISSVEDETIPAERSALHRILNRRPKNPNYRVLDPHGFSRSKGKAGPPPIWVNMPTLSARFIARKLRDLRDWAYVISILGLVMALVGYLFQQKTLLHLGGFVVVAANIGVLCVGTSYLLMLPFKESFWKGLFCLFPPYAIYYWASNWSRLKRPVVKTLGAFLPIVLVGWAILIYRETPIVEKKIEENLPEIEKKIDDTLDRVESEILPPPKAKSGDPSKNDESKAAPAEKTPNDGGANPDAKAGGSNQRLNHF